MVITQDNLMKEIAKKQDVDVSTVRNIFKSAEEIIFEHLSSTIPSENIVVKLLSGINIERKYVQQKKYSKGMFQNLDCPAHVRTKASLSTYYNRQVNQKLFEETFQRIR